MEKMKEGSWAYNDEAIQLALSLVDIAPCIDCGHPVNKGYCCGHCGSGNGTLDTGDYADYFGYEPNYKALNCWD